MAASLEEKHLPPESGTAASSPGSSSGESSLDLGPTSGDEEQARSRHGLGSSPAVLAGTVLPSGPEDFGAVLAARSGSRASSARSRPLSVVPRARRRGLFGRFTIVPEVERPYDYKTSTKWGITATIAFATIAAPIGSAIFFPALPAVSRDFATAPTVANLTVALYMLSMSIFPLWWSSFSEQFGRRSVSLISFALFIVSAVLCAVSTNMSMLIVFRTLSGGASASVQAVGAGIVADIWEPHERGRAMSTFYLGPMLGPLIAPILGGVLAQSFGWQASMYFLAVYGAFILILLFFLLPETLARPGQDELEPEPEPEESGLSRCSTAASAKAKTRKLARGMRRILVDPLAVLLFLRFPSVLITVLVAAIAFGALFIASVSIQQKFSEPPYSYSQLVVGLLYVPSGLGSFLAALFGGQWIDRIMAREAKKANRYDDDGKLVYLPEDRMRENMWMANTLYPLGLLLFGWTLKYGVIWVVPSMGTFIFGISSMVVFTTATTMLTEFVRQQKSAGVAVGNFVRNLLSCVGTIIAAPWINAVGTGWVFFAICLFCMTSGYSCIWILARNAARWRREMDQALLKKRRDT